jgi:hypothetical protein
LYLQLFKKYANFLPPPKSFIIALHINAAMYSHQPESLTFVNLSFGSSSHLLQPMTEESLRTEVCVLLTALDTSAPGVFTATAALAWTMSLLTTDIFGVLSTSGSTVFCTGPVSTDEVTISDSCCIWLHQRQKVTSTRY